MRLAHLSRLTVGKIENAEVLPSLDTLYKIATACNTTACDILRNADRRIKAYENYANKNQNLIYDRKVIGGRTSNSN